LKLHYDNNNKIIAIINLKDLYVLPSVTFGVLEYSFKKFPSPSLYLSVLPFLPF
jgi:hypothetical protein